jgi:HlyD family secretion protein
MKSKTRTRIIIAALVVVAVGSGVAVSVAKLRKVEDVSTPTARVTRGDVSMKVFTTGDLRPPRSAVMTAPSVGTTLQVVRLVHTGTIVKSGDVVVQFDPSEQEYNLEQAQSQLQQAEEQIAKAKADSVVQTAVDQVALLHAKYAVRQAELDCSLNELDSAIDAKKNDLALEEAKRKLAQLEQDVTSRAASNKALLDVAQEQRNKAQLDIKQAQQRIDSMTLKSPMDGIVTIKDNTDAGGGFFSGGMSLPEYQEGDLVSSGRSLAQVFDTSQMEIVAHVPETARADLNAGQMAQVNVDALPGVSFTGKIKTVAGQATTDMFSDDPTQRFDVTFALDRTDSRLRPGLTSQIIVLGDELKSVLYLPRQSMFIRDGKPVVYVRVGRSFEPRAVNINRMTESQIVVDGLAEGTEVSLINPERLTNSHGAAAAGAAAKGGA